MTIPTPEPPRRVQPRGVRERLEDGLQDAKNSWRDLTGAPQGSRSRLVDLLLIAGLLMWVLVTTAGIGTGWLLLGVVMVIPLFWRRTHPLASALGVALACLIQLWAMNEPHPANIAVLIAIYSAAAFGTRRESRAVLILGMVGALLAGVDWSVTHGSPAGLVSVMFQTGFLAAFVAVVWVLGDVVRRRKAVVSRLEAQNRALARDQQQRAKLAAQDERASIAREMHDVVAHSLAVVVVQADGALYAARAALDSPPGIGADRAALEKAAQTLETLGNTARASLADTRRLVGVLREEGAGAEYSPLQGLAHLDDLVERVRQSGVVVDLAVRGQMDDLPADVDLAAYRVVQESLTNAMKHAGPEATVEVDVLRTPSVLLVRVTDDGNGLDPQSDGEGNGILGMSERVDVLGGSVHAGPRRVGRGGWEVVATIPVKEEAPELRWSDAGGDGIRSV